MFYGLIQIEGAEIENIGLLKIKPIPSNLFHIKSRYNSSLGCGTGKKSERAKNLVPSRLGIRLSLLGDRVALVQQFHLALGYKCMEFAL